MAKIWRSMRELGLEFQASYPNHEGIQQLDPERLGKALEPELTGEDRVVDEYSDIDFGNLISNVPSDFMATGGESFEAIKEAAWSPWEKLIKPTASLVGGGISEMGRRTDALDPSERRKHSLIGLLGRGLDATGLVDEEDRELARQAYQGFTESFDPAALEQRPMNALANATSLLPVGPSQIRNMALLQKLTKGSKVGKAADAALSVASPDLAVEQALTLLPQLAKAGAKRAPAAMRKAADVIQRNRIARGATEQGKETLENLKVGERALGGEVAQSALAISTGRSRQFIHQIFERAKNPEFRKFFRRARRMDEAALTQRLQKTAFEGMNKLQRIMTESYDAATKKVFGGEGRGPLLDGEPLRRQLLGDLAEAGVTISKRTGRLQFSKSAVTDLGPARAVLQKELRGLLRLLKVKRGVPAKEIHRRRKLIDDALSVIQPESGISDTAAGTLMKLRGTISTYLRKNMDEFTDGEYGQALDQYQIYSNLRDDLNKNIKLAPGQLQEVPSTGQTLIKGGTQEKALRGLEGSVMGPHAPTRMASLERLEQITGVTGIVDLELAKLAQALAGGGLIVRNELAQIVRRLGQVAAGGAISSVVGGVAAIPVATLFSPRFVSEYMLMLQGGAREGLASMTKASAAKMRRRVQRVTDTMHRMDRMTGGELRKRAIREQWNVGTMLERLEIQEEQQGERE